MTHAWKLCLPALCCLILAGSVPAASQEARALFEMSRSSEQVPTELDRIVRADLERADISPAPMCSDAVFIRRTYLDVIGMPPRPEETEAFLASQDPEKRNQVIDALLGRPEFTDYWAM
ncbi:MAG TPA: DUF1549 domain-containing protein, partial [Candidatus Hydrogenedentes bacterium]|nr:DUF1549 domain-containing protein [Candidatus Hydrogenedentota bacterium]